MDEESRRIARLNIARYVRLLASETDPATRRTLLTLLAEARGEERLIDDEGALDKAAEDAAALRKDAARWRMRAKEYRTVAEATTNESARNTFLHLARSYEALATHAESRANRAQPGSQAG